MWKMLSEVSPHLNKGLEMMFSQLNLSLYVHMGHTLTEYFKG